MPTAREARIVSRRAAALEHGEEIETALSGFFAALPRGGYYGTPVPLLGGAMRGKAYGWDPYDLVLTTKRLLAFPSGSLEQSPTFECDRSTAHVEVLRRVGAVSWISAIFHDRELRMLVSRGFREPLKRMRQTLP
jgi:hypothetical protein